MKHRLVTILFSFLIISTIHAQNTDNAGSGAGKVDTMVAQNDGSDIFARIEIRKMDSMLNLLYVQNELSKKNSVLSKYKDDTTAYAHRIVAGGKIACFQTIFLGAHELAVGHAAHIKHKTAGFRGTCRHTAPTCNWRPQNSW